MNAWSARPVRNYRTYCEIYRTVADVIGMTANGMVRPCSCPASKRSWQGAPKTRSTPCLRQPIPQSPCRNTASQGRDDAEGDWIYFAISYGRGFRNEYIARNCERSLCWQVE